MVILFIETVYSNAFRHIFDSTLTETSQVIAGCVVLKNKLPKHCAWIGQLFFFFWEDSTRMKECLVLIRHLFLWRFYNPRFPPDNFTWKNGSPQIEASIFHQHSWTKMPHFNKTYFPPPFRKKVVALLWHMIHVCDTVWEYTSQLIKIHGICKTIIQSKVWSGGRQHVSL